MKLADIKFTEHDSHNGSPLGANAGRYWVAKVRFEEMWSRANAMMQTLDWSKPQTVRTIFGDDEVWNSYKRGARIAFGRCLKYFAVHDMLPIRETNPAKTGNRKYVKA